MPIAKLAAIQLGRPFLRQLGGVGALGCGDGADGRGGARVGSFVGDGRLIVRVRVSEIRAVGCGGVGGARFAGSETGAAGVRRAKIVPLGDVGH